MYDHLTEGRLQGVIAPRCYVSLTIDLASEHLPFPLWSNDDYDLDALLRRRASDDPIRDDTLFDDDTDECANDAPGTRELSPWIDWRPDPDEPLLSVLLMAHGGQKYNMNEDDWDTDNRKDVLRVLDDLTSGFIIHNDLRPANIIRALADTKMCRVHKWNLADFAWSIADDPRNENTNYEYLDDIQRGASRGLEPTG
ncbi:uncharacterized protein B0H18DRAFT_1126070 [Fomitopsis serialis]|uniref:uncharacterized protein n=1 Tax=Fomitopsis serialis TaxID=139415 RepID=UPI002008912B|nr:uncharacterized protein B0H18DRAFT_1126070 [Neoantrodia serialis]KAH9913666.1 hypothetical protein B0H18DRAFT_1126070 [Neoantrodia serialis]